MISESKATIIRNFSRYARSYDKYAGIQERVGSELLGLIKEESFRRILEIGCGTGNYTRLLRKRFRDAGLQAVDISDRMIDVASEKLRSEDIEFIVADAEAIEIGGDFDCITSNASFQWFSDLGKAIKRYGAALKEGGIILFSIFGPDTFKELNSSLKDLMRGSATVADSFKSKGEIGDLLRGNFKSVCIREALYEESFPRLKDLLRKIKFSGIRGNGMNGGTIFTPRLLKELEQVYLDRFKRINATYQIFYCEGRR